MAQVQAAHAEPQTNDLSHAEERLRKAMQLLEWRVQEMDTKLQQSIMQVHLRHQDAQPQKNLFGEPITTEPPAGDLNEELKAVQNYDREMRSYVHQLLQYLGSTIRQIEPVVN